MTRDKLYFESRINLLKTRSRDNGNIIKKCERQIRKLEKK